MHFWMRLTGRSRAGRSRRDMKSLLKAALRRTPYRVIRARDTNRFEAIEETLTSLSRRRFAPRIVLDGGANVGDFARLARRVFGEGLEIHLFEPQPACQPLLEVLARQSGFILHAAAIGSVNDQVLELAIDPVAVTTGAHVAPVGSKEAVTVPIPVLTLDRQFDKTLNVSDRTLLKLDLQGWELEALRGAVSILPRIEVVLIEVSFFAQAYEPSIAALVRFLGCAGFDLHDVASLSGRSRDNRARQADFVFVNRRSPLATDTAWA